MTAAELREQFRAIPKPDREARQDFAIRVWRALSWIERAQRLDPADYEGRFISAWIAFNALYGRLQPGGHPLGDARGRRRVHPARGGANAGGRERGRKLGVGGKGARSRLPTKTEAQPHQRTTLGRWRTRTW